MKQLKIIVLLTLAVSFSYCNQSSKKQNSQTNQENSPIEITESNGMNSCYLAVLGKDSVKLELVTTKDKFKGFMHYKFFETDNSIGTYEGILSGDTLKGIYRLLSEGIISYSEKYFLLIDNQLLEGVGEIEFPNDSTVKFKDPDRLTYGESINLEKVDCKENFIPKDIKKFYEEFVE